MYAFDEKTMTLKKGNKDDVNKQDPLDILRKMLGGEGGLPL